VIRLAMLAPIAWQCWHPSPGVPCRGGHKLVEQAVANLADGLVQLGLDATLYATGDSGI
jgi:hypothetical protein